MEQPFQPISFGPRVVVDQRNEFSAGNIEPRGVAARETSVFRELENFDRGKVFFNESNRTVARSVIDQDDFAIGVGLVGKSAQARFEKSLAIPVNDNNADPLGDVSMNQPLPRRSARLRRCFYETYSPRNTASPFHDPQPSFPAAAAKRPSEHKSIALEYLVNERRRREACGQDKLRTWMESRRNHSLQECFDAASLAIVSAVADAARAGHLSSLWGRVDVPFQHFRLIPAFVL